MENNLSFILKIIAFGDTHIGHTIGNFALAREKYVNMTFDAMRQGFNHAKAKKADLVIHTGDFFNRSKPPNSLVSRAGKLIEEFLDHKIPLLIVPGNHDKANLPWTMLEYFNDHFTIFNSLKSISIGDLQVTGFPFAYQNPRSSYAAAIKLTKRAPHELQIIACHQLFYGATFGPHRFTFSSQADVIDVRKFQKKVDLTISGHIHRSQILTNQRTVYTGSTNRTSMAEAIEPKGFLEITIDDDFYAGKFIRLNVPEMSVIEITGENIIGKFRQVCEQINRSEMIYHIRIYDLSLRQDQISIFFKIIADHGLPYVTFSPKKVGKILSSLYDYSKYDFNFSKFSIERGSLISL